MRYPAYPNYKPSGVEWLGDVPGHWEALRFKLLFRDIYRYPTYYEIEYVDEGVPEVRGESLIDGRIERLPDQRFISEETNRQFPRTILQEGDLVMSVRGTMGKVGLVSPTFAGANITANLLRLSPRRDCASGMYLSWLMRSEFFLKALDRQSPQTTIQTITMPQLASIRLPIPPLPEQRVIVEYLDRETAKLDTLMAKKRALIEKLKEKRTALISRTVTRSLPPEASRAAGLDPYPKLKPSGIEWLGEVPEHWEVKGGRLLGTLLGSVAPPEDDILEDNDGTPYAKVDDLNHVDSSLSLIETKVRVRGIPARPRKIILFPKRGAAISTNKVVIADGLFLFDSNLTGWQIHPSQDTKFVAYCLMARRLDDLADVSTVPQINNKHIYPAKFPCPPLNEQKIIVTFLDCETAKIDQMLTKVEAAIERLQEYRTALITASVTGKIEVRGATA